MASEHVGMACYAVPHPEARGFAWRLTFSAPDPAGLISNNPILAPPQKSPEYLRPIAICGIRRISMNFVRHSLHVPTKSALWLCKQIDVDQNNKDALSRKTLQYNELQCISSPFPLATCWGAEGLLLWVSKQHPKPNYVWRWQYEHTHWWYTYTQASAQLWLELWLMAYGILAQGLSDGRAKTVLLGFVKHRTHMKNCTWGNPQFVGRECMWPCLSHPWHTFHFQNPKLPAKQAPCKKLLLKNYMCKHQLLSGYLTSLQTPWGLVSANLHCHMHWWQHCRISGFLPHVFAGSPQTTSMQWRSACHFHTYWSEYCMWLMSVG